ncbi:hypothetical protein SO802_033635 [Lithocarpus litseifolius]|uniref:Uncharacterized protein n=1 Tax=Lithocarpus litseifolius TaxID=425828 RepID=A0AAW2BDK8_9ROSI
MTNPRARSLSLDLTTTTSSPPLIDASAAADNFGLVALSRRLKAAVSTFSSSDFSPPLINASAAATGDASRSSLLLFQGDFVLKDLKLQAERPHITITSSHCARKFRRLSKAIHLHFLSFCLDDYVQTPTSVQNPAPVQNPTPENRRARRGKTKLADIWAMTSEYKIQLPLNDEGQPIGKDGSLFVRWLGTFCENGMLCPLTPAGWPSVGDKFKQDCWTEIEKRYIIDPNIVAPPNQMAWAMHQLGELRRNRRTKLKKDHVKTGLTRQQTLSDKNKASRDKQEEISRSGAKSLAQISDEMAKAKGSAVERAENRMTELLNDPSIRLQGEIDRGILWSNNDAYARVMSRPERPGRVRGVGFGITPSGRNATNLLQFASTPSSSGTTLRISELETNYEQLKEQVAQSEARHREELAQSEARHQQQMADVMTSVRDMINQISQGARDVSTQGGSA